MKTRKCAVCGKEKAINKFGTSLRCPKTTCLDCKEKVAEYTEKLVKMFVKRIILGGK